MLTTLGMDMTFIMMMTVVSTIANMPFLRLWGRYADRFSNKTILAVCAPVFVLCIFAWMFTTFPDKHRFTIPMLVVIHLVMGTSSAGVTLASGNIGLKLALKGEATAYLALLSLVSALTAGMAPIIGGLFADFFAQREVTLLVQWFSPERSANVPILYIQHWGFLFMLAVVLGLFSINRLKRVEEAGEVKERAILQELMLEARRSIRNLSSITGLRALATFPFVVLRRRSGVKVREPSAEQA
jgi:MFS family permease